MSPSRPFGHGAEAGAGPMHFKAMDADVLHRPLAWRRDVRHLLTDPVDEAVLTRLRGAMGRAPSVGNARPWRVVRVESPALRGAVGSAPPGGVGARWPSERPELVRLPRWAG